MLLSRPRMQAGVAGRGWFRSSAPRPRAAAVAVAAKVKREVDVVVVGAGIIGLLSAEVLLKKGLSVALVERKQLCAGATGAGQGYIWMAHRSPNTAAWDLASYSMIEYELMMREDPSMRSCIEWQDTGSLLLATTSEEEAQLQSRQALLQEHGIKSDFLWADEVQRLEPALSHNPMGPELGGALLTASDAQINGRLTAHGLLARCKAHPGLRLMLDEPVERVLLQPSSTCPSGVETASSIVGSRLGTVVAAGVWSGELLAAATGQSHWSKALQPRRGHLLELTPPRGMAPIKHGIMEMSYTKHYATKAGAEQEHGDNAEVDITFTATTSAAGTLLVGSSREFSGWCSEPSDSITQAIMERATQFLPGLKAASLPKGADVRVGLRPFATRGLPIVGPVPGFPGLIVAAGHEGSGLCLGPATAQLVCHHLTGESRLGKERPLEKLQDLLPPQQPRL